jgi:hypothetical protein
VNNRIQVLARVVVMRGCGFATLGIAVFIFAVSSDGSSVALRAGAYLGLVLCMALVLKAWATERRHHRNTELWLLLSENERPAEPIAQQVISSAMRDAYLEFAMHVAAGSAVLLVLSLVVAAFTPEALTRQ